MSRNKTAGLPRQDQALVTAAEWFAGGQRIWYGPGSARVLTAEQAAAAPGALRVFERVATSGHGADAVWLTMLPGFPDLLAAAIRDIAARHGVGTPATASR